MHCWSRRFVDHRKNRILPYADLCHNACTAPALLDLRCRGYRDWPPIDVELDWTLGRWCNHLCDPKLRRLALGASRLPIMLACKLSKGERECKISAGCRGFMWGIKTGELEALTSEIRGSLLKELTNLGNNKQFVSQSELLPCTACRRLERKLASPACDPLCCQ